MAKQEQSGLIEATKRCPPCDTAIELESSGQRLVFTAHDAAFCSLATQDRIRMLEKALRQAAEERAEAEAGLRRRLEQLEVEIEVLREIAYEAADRRSDRVSGRALRVLGDERRLAQMVDERLERRRERWKERLVEVQRLAREIPPLALIETAHGTIRLTADPDVSPDGFEVRAAGKRSAGKKPAP